MNSMQRFIFRNKNKITLLSAFLIATAYISKWAVGNIQFFTLALIVASVIGVMPIAIQAYQALRVRVVSIDVLVTIAVIGAFLISNFEESAIVTFLFLFGAYLEQRTLNNTRKAIKELTEMAPETALKQMLDDVFEEVDVEEVEKGDLLLVKTGAKVPVDGKVVDGEGYVNEASITGESVVVGKEKGSKVFAGTILENGTIKVIADKVGEDTTFGKIIELVEEAQDSKSEAERFIDRFSKYYTPAVLVLAFVVWIFTQNVELAITILVLGCPGALVIGVPVSNVAGIGNGAKNGVLLKGSEVINDFANVHTMVFDKTGTLTVGNPLVSETIYYGSNTDMALGYLASIENESDHPLAKAVLKEIGEVDLTRVENTEVMRGGGIVATVGGRRMAVGNVALMESESVVMNDRVKGDIEKLVMGGNSLVLTSMDGELQLLMGVRDQIRPNVKEHLNKLKSLGVKNIVILSGDNQATVNLVSNELGITEAYGNMLPEDKSAFIKKLKDEGKIVAFVGDGVNDSPSLALANVGIAMGSGTDVAIDTSDLVLINSNFKLLPYALGLVKATLRNMKQNIFIAVGVVALLFGGLLFSNWVSMSVGMLVHEISILVVILNGMRLLSFKLK